MTTTRLKGFFFFLGVLGCGTAYGFTLPSHFIVKGWVDKHPRSKGMKIVTRVSSGETDDPAAAHFKLTLTWNGVSQNSAPHTLKSLAVAGTGQKLYTAEKEISALSLPEKLLVGSDFHDLNQSLKEIGFSLSTEINPFPDDVSMDRWNGSIAWNVKSSDSDVQLWIEQDTFFPLRLIFSHPKNGRDYEIQFFDFRVFHGFSYPRIILVLNNNSPVLKLQTESVEELGYFKFSSGGVQGFTETGKSFSSSIQELIHRYYDIFQ